MTQKEFEMLDGDYSQKMTALEVASMFGISEATIRSAFPRSQKSIFKKFNKKLVKVGRGEAAVYYVQVEESNNDKISRMIDESMRLKKFNTVELFDSNKKEKRASTMYQEEKESVSISTQNFAAINWDFFTFLGVAMTPQLVFRGTYKQFLSYCDIAVSRSNIEHLKESIASLVEQELLMYKIDPTNENYFVIAIFRKVEQEMKIGVNMVRICKQLSDAHQLKNWIPLLKTWIGVEMMAKEQPYTQAELSELTGISKYSIRSSISILEESNIFRTSKAYLGLQCLGTNVDLNVEEFYEI